MFNFTTLARQALLAVALVVSSGTALAGPHYQVTIHTEGYSGESGLLDFAFESNTDAPGAIATLWNFTGDFGDEYDRSGDVTGDLAGGVTFTTGNLTNYLTHSLILGGDVMFDIIFSGDYEMIDSPTGSTFFVALYDAGMTEQLGAIVQFDLIPGFDGAAASVLVAANADLADVSEIPEPSQLLLMLSALALAGFVGRRARNQGA
ncbi:MAG: NF038129 family PEP-CTERM protein [Pseudomonadota bacterium]